MKKKNLRIHRIKNLTPRQTHPEVFIDRGNMDIGIFDLVMKMLYENSDKNTMHLENEIFQPFNINLPKKETERIWDVLISSGFISPIMGFGNAGKVALTKTGYQIMSQYGTYSKFMEHNNPNNAPQPAIVVQMNQPPENGESKDAANPGQTSGLDNGVEG